MELVSFKLPEIVQPGFPQAAKPRPDGRLKHRERALDLPVLKNLGLQKESEA